MKRYRIGYLGCLLCFFFLLTLQGEAAGMEGARITMSPDGKAFTTNAGETNTKWYQAEYEVNTGVKSDLPLPREGEHYYSVERDDIVPVEKWKVMLARSKCQHDIYPEGNLYHGVSFGKQKCLQPYYSGWFGYCADCKGVVVEKLFYMSEETAKSITYLDMSKSYYYKCPHCENLEQGIALKVHMCTKISANRYYVRYHGNYGSGYMEKSSHMVNNCTEYEGRRVTPQTSLTLNTFTRTGYEFIGWNTRQDGSGTFYEDGATIYNLSTEENASVVLYAQWKKSKSILEIDANGGSYLGKKEITRITGEYGTTYRVEENDIIPPEGYCVQFDTMGGEKLENIRSTRVLRDWKLSQPFMGKWENGLYQYKGKDGSIDRITAQYGMEGIILPEAVRKGYSFGGWYADSACTVPVGRSGEMITPHKDMVLYAGWVDLTLTAQDNYLSNQGKGAVDLSWIQKDNRNKIYEVYQKTSNAEWKKINDMEEKENIYDVEKTVLFSGEKGSYTVPYTGFYVLTLAGAQGQNYGNYTGGKGGRIQATVFLEQGEKLEYVIGGQNGYSGGGTGSLYGNGGGYSKVSSGRYGTIMIAGGGGGATAYENGKAGGLMERITEDMTGGIGEAGGGGGYQGGMAGKVEIHYHTKECQHLHIGDPGVYGGCYVNPVECGSTDIHYKILDTYFYYGNIADDGSKQICPRCNSRYCSGHLDTYGEYTCKECGNKTDKEMKKCTAISRYGIGCDRDENYICGLEKGELIRSQAAGGGSNYINPDACIQFKDEAGVQQIDGYLHIQSSRVGFLMEREWKGVSAIDMEPPLAIDEESVVKTAVAQGEVRITFQRPDDVGTKYYHQVKSFSVEDGKFMCESNITQNILVSQVIGYRYTVDYSKETCVNASHSFLKDKGVNPFVTETIEEREKYLHVAPEDKAGNVGPSIHIRIADDEVVYWPLMTEKLILEEGKNVAPAETADTYYVRADGDTPFQLNLEGLLCGIARKNYQINEATFSVENEGATAEGGFTVLVPGQSVVKAGTFTYPTEKIQKRQSGFMGLMDASYTVAKRYNFCKSLFVEQKFVIPQSCDGNVMRVIPGVAALGEAETVYSLKERDVLNSILLIADGTGPKLEGLEQWEDIEVLDYSEGNCLRIQLTAKDTGSGLEEFYVEVQNPENGLVKRYEDPGKTGRLEMVISDEEAVYNGKFIVLVYARDRVGNESFYQNDLLGVGLDAYVKRVMEPHTPVFKKGESGILHIRTWGYVEKLEICFPLEMTKEDGSLNRMIVYETPECVANEEILFMVPLGALDGEMTICVRAYKSGTGLETEPEMIVIKVEDSVLNELRTRLR